MPKIKKNKLIMSKNRYHVLAAPQSLGFPLGYTPSFVLHAVFLCFFVVGDVRMKNASWDRVT